MAGATTRGVLFVHSAPRALCPHVEWAAGNALGVRVSMDNSTCMNCQSAWFWSSDTTEGVTTIFFDDFSDGTIGEVDPEWELVKGSWKVAMIDGYEGGNILKSSRTHKSTVIVREEAMTGGPFVSGTIALRLKVGGAESRPDALVFFDSTGPDAFRAVRLRQKDSGWFLQIVQNGDFDGDTERTEASVKLRRFSKSHWHRLTIEVGADGTVAAVLTDEADPQKSWGVGGAFAQNSGGAVGFLTRETVVAIDYFSLEALDAR